MTTWAASTFNNELDVLEIRLETLGDVVDRFVLAEATVTQRNQPKPLNFEANKDRFEKWLDRITYIVVDDMPGEKGFQADWVRERFQRNALQRGFYDALGPNDRVLVSDLDEIPYPDALRAAIARLDAGGPPTKFLMDMHVYRLNWRWLDRGCLIGSTAAVFRPEHFSGRDVHDALLASADVVPAEGVTGWHLAYQGDVNTIRNKMTCIADNFYEQLIPTEMKADGWTREDFLTTNWIRGSIDTGRDIYGRSYRPSEWVGLWSLPPCVQENPERYAHMMVPPPENPPRGPRCSCGAIFGPDGELAHFPKCQLYNIPGTLQAPGPGVFQRR